MPDLPAAQNRFILKVPVELWREIFTFVTSVPHQYEFTPNGAAYVMANEASRTETGIPNKEEIAKIVKSRLLIVQVCRHWYSMGIQSLWSHLCINPRAVAVKALAGIQGAIDRDPTLASFVLRLTVVGPFRWQIPVDLSAFNRRLQELTGRLPSLQTYICSADHASGMAKPSLDIVVWERFIHPKVFGEHFDQVAYIQNTRVLSIALNNVPQALPDRNPMLFPRLESLHLRVLDPGMADHITRSWHLPNIEILSLSIKITGVTPWIDFIEKWGNKIRVLELVLRIPDWPRPIQLPALRELLVDGRTRAVYKIVAPKLERFSIFWLDVDYTIRADVIALVDHSRKSFPTLKRLRLLGFEQIAFKIAPRIAPVSPPAYGFIAHDLDGWREAGLEVDVKIVNSAMHVRE